MNFVRNDAADLQTSRSAMPFTIASSRASRPAPGAEFPDSVTPRVALRAGQIDGQMQARGIRIPLSDLLIGTTALELEYRVGTANVRHFQQIEGLEIVRL